MAADIPTESRFKYGRDCFDDIDPNELAEFLSGNGLNDSGSPDASSQLSGEDEVDADFFRKAGNPDRHYGDG